MKRTERARARRRLTIITPAPYAEPNRQEAESMTVDPETQVPANGHGSPGAVRETVGELIVGQTAITRPAENDGTGDYVASRVVWLNLPAPFAKLQIEAWLDYPREVAVLWTPVEDETRSEASERVKEACKRTFLRHRAPSGGPWLNPATGEAYPDPSTDEFWEQIPTPLFSAIVTRLNQEMEISPLSRASRRAKRRS